MYLSHFESMCPKQPFILTDKQKKQKEKTFDQSLFLDYSRLSQTISKMPLERPVMA